MLEFVYNKVRNTVRKIDMKIARARYGYIEKLPKNIDYFEGSLYDVVYDASCKWPHNIAIEYYNVQVTYREFIKKVNKTARALKALGVNRGDKITICMPNTPEAVYMFYAISEVGAVANMIHPLSSEKEIEDYLNRSHSKIMLCVDAAYSKVEAVLKNTEIEHLIVVSATKSMEFIVKFFYWATKGRKNHIKKSQQILLWDNFISKSSKFIGNPHERVDSNDLAMILYSGGTTGKSKGVMLSNMNFNAQSLEAKYYAPGLLDTNSAFLTFLPNFHAFGIGICTHMPLSHGGRVILIPQFSAKKIKSYLKKYKFNVLCGVPTLYEFMANNIKLGKKDLKGLKGVIAGGDSMSLAQKQKVNKYLSDHGCKHNVRVGYGLTEAAGVIAFSPEGITDSADVIGYAFPDCEFLICDLETGKEAMLGHDGEILIHAPSVMLGYLDNPEETEAAFVTIGKKKYLKTGDIGFIDKKGLLHFKARLKRMIITNGYNVYPSSIEEVIMKSKLVEQCAVIGVKDNVRGEVAKAFIVLKDDVSAHAAKNELQKMYKQYLAKYEIPRMMEFVDNLPTTKMGKIDFKALEQL